MVNGEHVTRIVHVPQHRQCRSHPLYLNLPLSHVTRVEVLCVAQWMLVVDFSGYSGELTDENHARSRCGVVLGPKLRAGKNLPLGPNAGFWDVFGHHEPG